MFDSAYRKAPERAITSPKIELFGTGSCSAVWSFTKTSLHMLKVIPAMHRSKANLCVFEYLTFRKNTDKRKAEGIVKSSKSITLVIEVKL